MGAKVGSGTCALVGGLSSTHSLTSTSGTSTIADVWTIKTSTFVTKVTTTVNGQVSVATATITTPFTVQSPTPTSPSGGGSAPDSLSRKVLGIAQNHFIGIVVGVIALILILVASGCLVAKKRKRVRGVNILV